MIAVITFFIVGLCWGSFLNVVAYRLLHRKKFFTMRSSCPSCRKTIAWYDNIPLLSWCILRARCRACGATISWLYPIIELGAALVIAGVITSVLSQHHMYDLFDILNMDNSFIANMSLTLAIKIVFVSALLASTRTDLEAMVIPQCFTLWLVPVGIGAAYAGLLPIKLLEAVLGALFGYGVLWVIAFIFRYATGKEGMGEGDMELMMMIGSFLGPFGVWIALLVGSLSGMVMGVLYLWLAGKQRTTRIPFGPFLSLGAMLYLLFDRFLLVHLLGL